MMQLSQTELKSLLLYNSLNGEFTWSKCKNKNQVKIGDRAGHVSKAHGYETIKINGKDYRSHRLVFLYVNGAMPAGEVDHVNQNRSDNRLENLRIVTTQDNLKNKSMMKNNSSGFNGVNWNKNYNKFEVRISVNKKSVFIGRFKCLIDAVSERIKANIKYGFHKNHGKKLVV